MSLSDGNPTTFGKVGADTFVRGDASALTVLDPGSSTPAAGIRLDALAGQTRQAASDASDAKTSASEAVSAVKSAGTEVDTKLENYLPKSAVSSNGGVVGIDDGGGILLNTVTGAITYIHAGKPGGSDQTTVQFYSGSNEGTAATLTAWGGTGNTDGNLAVGGSALHPQANNVTSLGTSNNAWSGIVSQTAPQVVSDANDKTIVGTLGDSGYVDITGKLRAAWAAISGVVYTLKNGASDRRHIGVIAQAVQAAFTAQGLDPAEYGLWCSEPRTQIVTAKNEDGSTTTTVQPVYEADGKTQATQQTLRYEELLSLGLFCERLEWADLTARIAALEAKAASPAAA
ncbi:hypothetical protein GLF_0916 [Gluconobacter frateurii NBRC 101659]|nr:hypothetical protein GLF_0916 [Gluconobacter frateurii NBRC 101659]